MSQEQDLRARREALAQAVNRHDLPGVHDCIHPSFTCKTALGFSVGYKEVATAMEQLCAPGNNYQETVEIETIEVSGDSAKIVTRRGEQMERGAAQNKPRAMRPLLFLGIFFGGMAILSIPNVVRGKNQAVATLIAWVVASVVCLCWEYYLRRSVHRTKRYRELWRMMDGRWMIMNEQEI